MWMYRLRVLTSFVGKIETAEGRDVISLSIHRARPLCFNIEHADIGD